MNSEPITITAKDGTVVSCPTPQLAADFYRLITGGAVASSNSSNGHAPEPKARRARKPAEEPASSGGKVSVAALLKAAIEKSPAPDFEAVALKAYGSSTQDDVKRLKSNLYNLIGKGEVKRLKDGGLALT